MKHHEKPSNALVGESDVPVPMLYPCAKRRYFMVTLAILALTIVSLVVILLLSPGLRQQQSPPPDTDDHLPLPDTDPSPLFPSTEDSDKSPGNTTPEVDDLVSTTPGGDPSDDQENALPPPTEPTPPTIIEQIVLSGSAGLTYRSFDDGTCMVESIGSCTDACLIIPERSPDGDTVIGIASQAFAGCEQLVAIQIPATVTTIGACAFVDCPRLVQFSVSFDNKSFGAPDGILCSADGTALLSYPAGRPCPTAVIPASITYISAGAFSKTDKLTAIHYLGSLNAWRSMEIGDGNDVLYTLPKAFGK